MLISINKKNLKPFTFSTVVLKLYACIVGLIHGFGEIFQAGKPISSPLITALDATIDPEQLWHAGLPAFTIIPNYLLSGIITVLVCIIIMLIVLLSKKIKHSDISCVVLFVFLFFFGGGFIPPFIGLVTSISYTIYMRRNKTNDYFKNTQVVLSALWQSILVVLVLWLPSSWIIGWLFPGFMLDIQSIAFILFNIIMPIFILISSHAKTCVME